MWHHFGNNEIAYNFLEANNASLNALATEMNKKIEFISELAHFILTKPSVAGVVVPPLIATVINYFINDSMDDDSYLVPYPVMYVRQCFLVENTLTFNYCDRIFLSREKKATIRLENTGWLFNVSCFYHASSILRVVVYCSNRLFGNWFMHAIRSVY